LVGVAVTAAHATEFAPTVTLTGTIKARIETDLSFRVNQRAARFGSGSPRLHRAQS
jgi:hypothetical protein